MDRPLVRFFRGSLALELIDFLERLAPFSQPEPLLTIRRRACGERAGSRTSRRGAPFTRGQEGPGSSGGSGRAGGVSGRAALPGLAREEREEGGRVRLRRLP